MPSVISPIDPHGMRRNCVNLTQFLLIRSKQGLGWDRVCEAQQSNESPSGAFKQRDSLAQQDSKMEGPCPEKFPEKKNTAHAAQR